MRELILAGLLLANAGAVASPGGNTDESRTAKLEWPLAPDLAAYGVRLRMPYGETRQRMIKHGWTPDPTEANARHTPSRLPYPEFPEVLCGEGYDAICSGWFSKGSESRLLDVREVNKALVVRGSGK
jgi:hypothetical protein